MIIILPIGQDHLTLSRLPFVTGGLVLAFAIAIVGLAPVIEAGAEHEARSLEQALAFYAAHDYLTVSDAIRARFTARERDFYAQEREWIEWYQTSPDEAAELARSTPARPAKTGVVPVLDATGDVVDTPAGERALPRLDAETLEQLKADFVQRLAAVDPEALADEQERLDDLGAAYEAAVHGSAARRFAWVSPGPSPIGLITHVFVHASVIQLLINVLFLWIAAVKLEDTWGRPLFAAAFVAFGAIAAGVHLLVEPQSTAPLIGASGAVAGLMGAYVLRYARSKVKFVYAYMIFKPRFGSFDAPAFLMFPLWVFLEVLAALSLDTGTFDLWAQLGGFAAGLLLALAFKLTDFERRVLRREPEIEIDPDAAPLVAFQKPPIEAPRAAAGPPTLELEPATIAALGPDGLRATRPDGSTFALPRGDVIAIAAAQVTRVGGSLAAHWFGPQEAPPEPAVLLVLLIRRGPGAAATASAGCVLDASRLRYNRFMDELRATPRDNFFALLRWLFRAYPAARFIGDRERLAAGELPAFAGLDELAARLVGAAP
jgi:membrane associated rhomboid family serine protease